jgi:hypothetical protein
LGGKIVVRYNCETLLILRTPIINASGITKSPSPSPDGDFFFSPFSSIPGTIDLDPEIRIAPIFSH